MVSCHQRIGKKGRADACMIVCDLSHNCDTGRIEDCVRGRLCPIFQAFLGCDSGLLQKAIHSASGMLLFKFSCEKEISDASRCCHVGAHLYTIYVSPHLCPSDAGYICGGQFWLAVPATTQHPITTSCCGRLFQASVYTT